MFVTDQIIAEVADEMQNLFEVGDLHTRSSVKSIAWKAKDALADNGLPTRLSLCFVVAKTALMTWQETVHQTKTELG
tara:strand:+ start:566 stop:796 length:231 start_codon:yes stop_codon:yes gene_type:complete